MPDSQPTVEVTDPVIVDADVNSQDSSTADTRDKGSEIKSTLELVKSLQGSDKSPASENGQDTKSVPIGEDVDPELKAKLAEEEWAKTLSKNSQNRFRTLNDSNKALNQELSSLKEKAQRFDGYEQAVQKNQLSDEDVNSGFEIMGLLRSNPEQALKQLTPIIRGLLDYVGYTLPDELKADVEAGALTQDRAREIAASRQRETRSLQNAEAQTEKQQADQHRQSIEKMARTADDWDAKIKTSDPDWHLKQDRVTELVELHVLKNGLPASEKDAVKLFDDMKKRVDTDLKKFRPNPQPKTVMTGNASSSALAEPKNTLDVIRQIAGGNR